MNKVKHVTATGVWWKHTAEERNRICIFVARDIHLVVPIYLTIIRTIILTTPLTNRGREVYSMKVYRIEAAKKV